MKCLIYFISYVFFKKIIKRKTYLKKNVFNTIVKRYNALAFSIKL